MKNLFLFIFIILAISLTVPSARATFSTGGGDRITDTSGTARDGTRPPEADQPWANFGITDISSVELDNGTDAATTMSASTGAKVAPPISVPTDGPQWTSAVDNYSFAWRGLASDSSDFFVLNMYSEGGDETANSASLRFAYFPPSIVGGTGLYTIQPHIEGSAGKPELIIQTSHIAGATGDDVGPSIEFDPPVNDGGAGKLFFISPASVESLIGTGGWRTRSTQLVPRCVGCSQNMDFGSSSEQWRDAYFERDVFTESIQFSQTYSFKSQGSGPFDTLELKRLGGGNSNILDFISEDQDNTDIVGYSLFGLGNRGATNKETLAMFFNPFVSPTRYVLLSGQGGTGILRPLEIEGKIIYPPLQVTTTDATVTTVRSVPLNDNEVYLVEMTCRARRTDAPDRATYVRRATVFREAGGAATIEGAVQNTYEAESDATWDATLDVNVNDVRARVTGAVGKTIPWACTITTEEAGVPTG